VAVVAGFDGGAAGDVVLGVVVLGLGLGFAVCAATIAVRRKTPSVAATSAFPCFIKTLFRIPLTR
jgi:hypothetical protein